MRNGAKLCAISQKLLFCIWFFVFVFENNENYNFANENRKLISLIRSILNVASFCTKCFVCKIQTDKFCCLRNITIFQSDKDICVLCIGQAQNRAKAVGGNRQQSPRFQFFPSQLPPACPLLAPWLLNSGPHGILAAKGGLEVFYPVRSTQLWLGCALR